MISANKDVKKKHVIGIIEKRIFCNEAKHSVNGNGDIDSDGSEFGTSIA